MLLFDRPSQKQESTQTAGTNGVSAGFYLICALTTNSLASTARSLIEKNWNRKVFAFTKVWIAWLLEADRPKLYRAIMPEFAGTVALPMCSVIWVNLAILPTKRCLQLKLAVAARRWCQVGFTFNTVFGLSGAC